MALVIPAPAPGPDFSACHALIVDPRVGNRRLLHETLQDLGCASVQDTGKPREAWNALAQGGINVLFLDWSGDIDAVDFLRTLRDPDSRDRFLPVVVMTAYGGAADVATMRDNGASEFMLRPLSAEMVASRLRAVVRAPRLFIKADSFFGPDRRRRRVDWHDQDRRTHENWRSGDRRRGAPAAWSGAERRQGRAGFEPLERRSASRA